MHHARTAAPAAGGTGHPPEAKHLQHAEPTKKGRQDNGAVEHTPLMKHQRGVNTISSISGVFSAIWHCTNPSLGYK